ncbi:MAG TPA: DUF4157 domain-containing protein [Pyrinomonadaceae bacterium]|nr:DUF4157 domain-containing protein [Pyrinomonadaceae bacterium]
MNTPGDIYEQEADRIAEQVVGMPEPGLQRSCGCGGGGGGCPACGNERDVQGQLQTKCVGTNDSPEMVVPPVVQDVLQSPGEPLDQSTREFMEPRFGHDFSRVRVHTDARAAESARSVNALAYTVGRNIVFGAGQFSPGTRASNQLLAHELTHVVQQTGSARSQAPITGASLERDAERVAQQAGREDSPARVIQSGPTRLARAPQSPPAPTSSQPVPARYTYVENPLPGGRVQIRAYGVVGDPITRPGVEKKYPLPKDVNLPNYDRWHLAGPDATGAEAGIAYAPKNFNVSKTAEIENVVRRTRDAAREYGGEVNFDFTAECRVAGEHEGVEIRVLEKVTWKVEVRMPGSDTLVPVLNETAYPTVTPPATAAPLTTEPQPPATSENPPPVAEKPPAATAPAERPIVPEKPVITEPSPVAEPIPVTPEAKPGAAAPKGGGKWSGVGTGVMGIALPMMLGWLHSMAVEKRIEEKTQKEGYVPPGAPSGMGLLYDLGAWLIDPANDADKAVGIDMRFNLPVWRARIREAASARKPGETLTMTWDIGLCKFDFMGYQEIEKRVVVYRKQDDGKWIVESGDSFGTPNLNSIISTDIPDSTLKEIIMRDPCAQIA